VLLAQRGPCLVLAPWQSGAVVLGTLCKPLVRCTHNDMPGCSPLAACSQTFCSEADGAVAPLPPTAEGTVVVGSLANSYATYQLRLSARLAREHHALRWVGGG